ncbi:MAG: hypothetical protein Q8K30_06055 [Candidatus Gracilibacteria bacterium]|nr:hypothetical protein [Candidatus Gracilibacteria bacterium]
MKKYLDGYMKGLSIGLGILTIVGVSGIAYGAYVSMTDVNNGETLTASTFNIVQENIRTIKSTVDGHTTTLSGLSNIPTGAVMAFNGSSCPSGWTAADGSGDEKNTSGTNTTLDLRGEFIRGLDGGRGIDTGRTLASAQVATQIASNVSNANYSNSRNSFAGIRFLTDQEAVLNFDSEVTIAGNNDNGVSRTGGTFTSASVHYRTPRPRNVALLYCVKQ